MTAMSPTEEARLQFVPDEVVLFFPHPQYPLRNFESRTCYLGLYRRVDARAPARAIMTFANEQWIGVTDNCIILLCGDPDNLPLWEKG